MKTGLAIFCFIFLAALFAPRLATHDPYRFDLSQKLLPPSATHFLGTDGNGADIYSRLLYGARLSLKITFTVVLISVLAGLITGSLSGFYGSWVDQIVMRTVDMMQAFPGFLLALAIVAFIGSSVDNLILALSITGWTGYARLVRGEVQSLKSREFVTAARAAGVSDGRIIVRHLWPNVLAILAVQASFGLAGVVITEAGLSFLGLGAPPTEPSWGALLGEGRKYLIRAPHVCVFPGLAIMLLVLAFNLIGDGLRRQFNPKAGP